MKEFRSKLEKETIACFIQNNVFDIEKVIDRYNPYLYKMLKNGLSNESDIEEILSDVFTILWKNYQKLEENSNVKSYLIGITRNLVKKKYCEYKLNFENIECYEKDLVCEMDIEKLAENREKSRIIANSLMNMKTIEKEIFMLFYYQQKKIKQIAKILEVSESKVKIILHRTRKMIKKNLIERGYNDGK